MSVPQTTRAIPAEQVREGDFLVGLDNGYVPEAPEIVDEYTMSILFHTAEGDEATLVCPSDMPVTVRREQFDDGDALDYDEEETE